MIMMPSWLMSAVRTAIQAGWSYAATWLLSIGVDAPAEAHAWLTGAALAVVTLAVTAGIRWLEARPTTSWRGRLAQRAARWLMLGITARPTGYSVPHR
jgi:hypothetical protein